MEQYTTKEIAEAANRCFEKEIFQFLNNWVHHHQNIKLLQFDQTLEEYLLNDAMRDFFMNTSDPIQDLLMNDLITCHLSRSLNEVYFDPISGDPLLAVAEQRIYNLARRMNNEFMHVPFRTVHPGKQTASGDLADISTYPADSDEIRYNSGNHFRSRPANGNVFDENSKRCTAKSGGDLCVLFKRGFMEDRLNELKKLTSAIYATGIIQPQFFVIYSRHSQKEGHFGVSLVIMNPANPDFPLRVMVCDTLLKDLPQHPRWWNHFIAEFTQVFGETVAELMEDLSHPLQKVNVKGDHPYFHDWNCPYYAASMAEALADLAKNNPGLLLNGTAGQIHHAMKGIMTDYYDQNFEIRDRLSIQEINQSKRWNSGREMIKKIILANNTVNSKYFNDHISANG